MPVTGSAATPPDSGHATLSTRTYPRRVRVLLEGIFEIVTGEMDRGLIATLDGLEQQLVKLADQARTNAVPPPATGEPLFRAASRTPPAPVPPVRPPRDGRLPADRGDGERLPGQPGPAAEPRLPARPPQARPAARGRQARGTGAQARHRA